jgi:phage shock protein PspC (stress-responsive transcriptional regulator)
MARKKPKAAKRRKAGETAFEQRVKDFGEEVGDLGERFGKRMERHGKGWEKRGDEWDSWFHRTLGVVGPLVSSVIGIILMGLLVWAMSFIGSVTGSWIIADIGTFIAGNIGTFFLIFLFFSYASYFSKFHRKTYRLFSPLSVAVGASVCFWIAAHAANTANISIGLPVLSEIAFYINQNLLLVFWFFLFLGYLVLAIVMATEKTIFSREATPEKPVNYQRQRPQMQEDERMRRLYRSGRDKILGGVCGGIAEYLGVDPVIIRLLWIVGTLAWGFGIILYIICWIVMPRNPAHKWN